ncbi:ArdC-like ssDNA-binding domain-containing protein [Pseudomonas fluorescens]|uniref:ArdC-like ssDNA-binding domain-containing protein n=1 Tax=Pseudomonas fluorescens TaxID=294 RepID=UPI001BE99E08|nr:ArdC family protein [Pseudomonas fluorescens]MBT2375357.1 ArdC family protein [Pseudomonas fluorescens]
MRDIYQDVTDKIVAALDQGVVPWIKPWSSSGAVNIGHQHYPINAVTRRPYSGSIYRCSGPRPGCGGSPQDRCLTFNQAKKAGGHVRQGEHSTLAVRYKPIERQEQTDSGQPVLDESGQPKVAQLGILRTHFLFNIEQPEGLETLNETLLETDSSDPFPANSAAENLLLSSGARIVHRPADEAF